MVPRTIPSVANLSHILDPGELDRRITLQAASGSQDAYGEGNATWYDLAELWAKVEWKTGTEGMDAGQVAQSQMVDFTIRYRAVAPENRIKFEDKYYDIEGMEQIGRKRFLKLRTKLWDSNPI